MRKIIDGKFTAILLVSIFTFLYVDFWSKSNLGTYLSLLLFLVMVFVSLKNLSLGIFLTILYSILIIEFPRDILDIYEALQVNKTQEYNVISTVKVGPFTLLVYLVFINSFLAFNKLQKGFSISPKYFLPVFTLTIIGFLSMFRILLINGFLEFQNLIITDVKFILFLFSGIIQGYFLGSRAEIENFKKLLHVVPIILGLRAIFFVLNDFYNSTSSLDLMTSPYLSLVVITSCLLDGDWGIYKKSFYRLLLFISLLNPSRGFFIILAIAMAYGFFAGKKGNFNFKLKFIAQITLVLFLFSTSLLFFNERLFNFFAWKLNVFNEFFDSNVEVSGSGKVRFIELYNIVSGLSESFYETLFGRGFGATYDFSYFSISNISNIDLKSYSLDQLQRGVYYTAHSFFSSMLLKFGIFGLLIYFYYPVVLFIKFSRGRLGVLLKILPIIMIYVYYSRIEFMILMGILVGIVQFLENKAKSYV